MESQPTTLVGNYFYKWSPNGEPGWYPEPPPVEVECDDRPVSTAVATIQVSMPRATTL
jgi:hypothetical protein